MGLISRRHAGRLLLGGCAAAVAPLPWISGAPRIDSVVRGVQIGAQSYSFRGLSFDDCIKAFQTTRLGECELWEGSIVPPNVGKADLTKWRLEVPLDYFRQVRKRFDDAGVLLYAYNYSFRKQFTDQEIDRGFQMTRALGLKYITSSSNISMAHRIDRFAQKYKIVVAFHNHSKLDRPDDFSTAATFARALEGASPYLGVNLDIGHFTAAGGDPVAYLQEHHDRIVTLHIKDRKKNNGPAVPFGEGDTPIIPVLRLLRDRRWKIPANIEYEYGRPGLDPVVEVAKCYAYCRKALES